MRVRDVAWRAGVPARSTLILSIRLYRAVFSGWLGGQCRFSPTCSHYAEQAIRELGAVRGVGLATWRVARCNPYARGGIDPVPSTVHQVGYDAVLRTPQEARA